MENLEVEVEKLVKGEKYMENVQDSIRVVRKV